MCSNREDLLTRMKKADETLNIILGKKSLSEFEREYIQNLLFKKLETSLKDDYDEITMDDVLDFHSNEFKLPKDEVYLIRNIILKL